MSTSVVAPALSALVEKLIDYAGMFPPARLSLQQAIQNYGVYKRSEQAWMLRFFVVAADHIDKVPSEFHGSISLLGKADDVRAAALETQEPLSATRPVYCELPSADLALLQQVKSAGCYAKIRTGGLQPDAIPSISQVSDFIRNCSRLRLPFKATAGLHHAIRAEHALTYEDASPYAVMHGFLNVLLASAFCWHGHEDIEPILAETDKQAFRFDDRAHWRDISLTVEQIKVCRREFMHAIGSCSFDEPTDELQRSGLI